MMKHRLKELKEEINKFVIMDRGFHIPPFVLDRTFILNKKIKNIGNLNNSINQPNTTIVYKILHP